MQFNPFGTILFLYLGFGILVIIALISIILMNIKASKIKNELIKIHEVNMKILQSLKEGDKLN